MEAKYCFIKSSARSSTSAFGLTVELWNAGGSITLPRHALSLHNGG